MASQGAPFLSIMGSSRSNGNTRLVTEHFSHLTGSAVIDLNHKDVSYYDYEHKNREDDFLDIIRDFVANYQTMVLVTPIYWYTMSAQIKNFLDRTSDLITIEKPLGRQLRGKSMMLISQTEGDHFEPWFEEPIKLTAKYLGMTFLGHTHVSIEDGKISQESLKRMEQVFHTVD